MSTQVKIPCTSDDQLTELFSRARGRSSYCVSVTPEETTNPYALLRDTVTSLLVDYDITFADIKEYIMGTQYEIDVLDSGTGADPRELPRPQRHGTSVVDTACTRRARKSNEVMANGGCPCHNCNEMLVGLTECAICLEPISTKSLFQRSFHVASCQECGNVACGVCAFKLVKCPYCRSRPGLVPNFALQRLINRMDIPCKTAGWHEIEKGSGQLLCLHKNCQWVGEIGMLAQHMAQSHSCIVFEGSSVSLVISDFKRKVKLSATKPRNYCLVLSYLTNVFVCKIILMGAKLKFILVNVSRVEITDFALWVEVGCNKKAIQGIIPFLKKRAIVEVCTESLLSLSKKKSSDITISLTIRSLS